jgi:hypothetical protein
MAYLIILSTGIESFGELSLNGLAKVRKVEDCHSEQSEESVADPSLRSG